MGRLLSSLKNKTVLRSEWYSTSLYLLKSTHIDVTINLCVGTIVIPYFCENTYKLQLEDTF
jgi:hypothetical protein